MASFLWPFSSSSSSFEIGHCVCGKRDHLCQRGPLSFHQKALLTFFIAVHEVATGSLRKRSCRFTFSQCFPKYVTFSTECSVSAYSSRELNSGSTIHLELRGYPSHSNRCSLWNVTRPFSDSVERNMLTKRIMNTR